MAVDRKKLILEAAAKSFSMFGYKATTMDQVAKIANVGKGTIYTFFKNKEELFEEIINQLIQEMKERADASFNQQSSFVENVHRALMSLLEYRKKHQLTVKLFQEQKEIGTMEVKAVISHLENAILHYMQERVQEAMDKGEIKGKNSEITAFIILKLYIALIFDWEKMHDPLSAEEIASSFELHLFEGLSS
ncbi:TetR/AcrR family transcriptional regulator [Bacillus sp. B1-b2]|uniref:TetR/AcrR family transcriptional regulator n=1 Tax=Bacillus sp. B1-b2 TaxID=2653201 RepID=UPI001261EC03|nr:TetR/AcrR family transcriptional regulator [Bacillus sp. B1-b2]KAB7665371.1 TetR/AcrR family transcriptional regulator [Bacillus sp. B1-b2]